MNTGEPIKIVWEEPQPGTWRLVIMKWDEDDRLERGGCFLVHDIIESTDRNFLIRQHLKHTTPFNDDLRRVDFRWQPPNLTPEQVFEKLSHGRKP